MNKYLPPQEGMEDIVFESGTVVIYNVEKKKSASVR